MTDAVTIGVGSMVGAGVFSVWAPAASAAGAGLLAGLLLAAIVAYCNAMSSARLAARYPEFGGTYVYGRRRLGPFWGFLAGWSFVVGKTASCAAMALTVGNYIWPNHAHTVAVVAVVALTALSYGGVQRSALVTRAIVAVVLAVLGAVVTAGLSTAPRPRVFHRRQAVSQAFCRRPVCCSSPSRAMPDWRRSAKTWPTRAAPSRVPFPSRSASRSSPTWQLR